jgi:hypothetical protein
MTGGPRIRANSLPPIAAPGADQGKACVARETASGVLSDMTIRIATRFPSPDNRAGQVAGLAGVAGGVSDRDVGIARRDNTGKLIN